MAGFDEAWAAVAGGFHRESAAPELKPLLRAVHFDVLGKPTNLSTLKESLTALLEYLNGAGRTNASCWAVDRFFCLSEGWEQDWTEQDLPEDFHDVLAKMGEALHDTVKSPNIAADFDCLPEQLLQRVNLLQR
jgi:hypothetical protein